MRERIDKTALSLLRRGSSDRAEGSTFIVNGKRRTGSRLEAGNLIVVAGSPPSQAKALCIIKRNDVEDNVVVASKAPVLDGETNKRCKWKNNEAEGSSADAKLPPGTRRATATAITRGSDGNARVASPRAGATESTKAALTPTDVGPSWWK